MVMRNSRILVKEIRGQSIKSLKGSARERGPRNEKIPFGPCSRIRSEADRYSMKVGERRFKRCVVGMPERISFNPASPTEISRDAPFWRGMLTIRARVSLGSQERMYSRRSRFPIAARRCELRRDGSTNLIDRSTLSSEEFASKKSKRVSRRRLNRESVRDNSVRVLRRRNEG